MSEPQPLFATLRADTVAAGDRGRLFTDLSTLFVATDASMTEAERALMAEVLGTLVHDVEMELRHELAERLAGLPNAPRALVVMLANDAIEVARPLLARSPVLTDPDLIAVIRDRTREHRLAVALRARIGPEVADALIARNEPDVIEALLENTDAKLSEAALSYLVLQSFEIEQYRKPLLNRGDLPPRLAHRMFWWVSAALRRHILQHYRVDPALLGRQIYDAGQDALARPAPFSLDAAALALVDALAARRELNERFLVGALRAGNVSAFLAGFARLAEIDLATARLIALERGGEPLAIVCKALDIDRANFAAIFLHVRKGDRVIPTGLLQEMMALYDSIDRPTAGGLLASWRADGAAGQLRSPVPPVRLPGEPERRA